MKPLAHRFAVLLTLALLIPALPALAAPAAPAAGGSGGDTPRLASGGSGGMDQVVAAYRDLKQYQATMHLSIRQVRGRWTITQAGEVHLAYDRVKHRLKIDKPGLYVVAEKGLLRLRADQFPGKHLEVPIGSPVTFAALNQQAPFFEKPPALGAIFLLAKDPLSVLNHGAKTQVTALGPAPAPGSGAGATGDTGGDTPRLATGTSGGPRLTMPVSDGQLTLTLDPKTHLIRQAELEVAKSQLGGPITSVTIRYDFRDVRVNQPLPDADFAFDTTNSTAVGTLNQLAGGPGSGAGASGGGIEARMVGKDAPPIAVNTLAGKPFKLSEVKEKVIVLDFWATWCPPCRASLPHLQALYDWAKKNNKSVAVYAVNVAEDAKTVRAFWKKQGFTVPVLMDVDGKAGAGYGANQAIPDTAILSGGKIRFFHQGYLPGLEKQIKAEVEQLLK